MTHPSDPRMVSSKVYRGPSQSGDDLNMFLGSGFCGFGCQDHNKFLECLKSVSTRQESHDVTTTLNRNFFKWPERGSQGWKGTWDRTLEAKDGDREIPSHLKRSVQGRKVLF